ncbi:prolyl aminopeptidase [Actinomyces sp. 432]|uniref:alpha/beta fold hydrolase n=1 Tax=Actinomyces sp. 432 TaxID=2057798 RepID=UPI0013738ED2|nr:alpha/beta hydrolase [Actinomyces sp. 432]QHO91998.1 prolyl aminopeptidase [Actinomyces sp. 432]
MASMERRSRTIFARQGASVRRRLAGGREFELAYLRSGPPSPRPTLIIPGGPGLASISPYAGLRAGAARRGMDLLMVEHRGVGMSRRDTTGADLLVSDVTGVAAADDLAAVLDAEGVESVTVLGSSYGTYLAQLLAVRHPERVEALVLDSPILDPEDDLKAARGYRRRLLWDGDDAATHAVAAQIRTLAEDRPADQLAHVVQVVYEFAGPQTLHTLADAWREGRMGWLWKALAAAGRGEVEGEGIAFLMEPDLVSGIAYGELGYGLPVDGGPLDPQLFFVEAASRMPAFRGTPVDLRQAAPDYDFPIVVVSGDRDLRTPRPVAQRIAQLAPDAVLAPVADLGHSALDTHPLLALAIAHAAGGGHAHRIPERMAGLARLPRQGASSALGPVLKAAGALAAIP